MMTKTEKLAFYAAISICLVLLVSIIFGISVRSVGAVSADKIKTDFKAGSEGWTLNEFAATSNDGLTLIPSAAATTVDEMGDLLMFISIQDLRIGFEIKFGASEAGSACSLKFDNKVIRAEGLLAEDGKDSVLLAAAPKAGSVIKIEMIGGYVEISMKNPEEPYDFLGKPAATLYFNKGVSSDGKISLSASGSASVTISDVAIYSLDGKVNIDTEDYQPPAVEPVPNEKDDDNKLAVILMATLIPLGVILIGGAVAAVIIMRKRRNSHEKNS